MKGDFTRFSFAPERGYDRVLMQQGRLQTDADWNEQGEIAAHRQSLALADVIGPAGVSTEGDGFRLSGHGGLEFDGERHSIKIDPANPIHLGEHFAIDGWIRIAATGRPATIFCGSSPPASPHGFFRLGLDADGHLQLDHARHGESAGDQARAAGAPGIRAKPVVGRFTHIAVVCDHRHTRLFVDASLDVAFDRHSALPFYYSSLLVGRGLEAARDRDFFHGAIDRLRLWRGPLGDAEIASLARRNTLASRRRPVCDWVFGGSELLIEDIGESGSHGPSADASGPDITPHAEPEIVVGAGRCYIDGVRSEWLDSVSYTHQPMLPGAELPPRALRERNPGPYLFYLDAWERVVTAAEDRRLLDPAFGGVDTALRLQTVSQVRWRVEGARGDPRDFVPGALKVSASTEAAPIPNRFVRVEIHHAGFARGRADASGAPAFHGLEFERSSGGGFKLLDTPFAPLVAGQPVELANGDPSLTFETELRAVAIGADGQQTFHVGAADLARLNDGRSSWLLRPLATFKWSRDNGATVFPIAAFDTARLTLRIANPADKRGVLAPGIWVEVLDDGWELAGAPGALRGVATLNDEDFGFVSLGLDSAAPQFQREPRNPRLRTWDPIVQSGGLSGCAVVEAGGKTLLAGGLEIEFTAGCYLTQDFWTVAVRAELDWPRDSRNAPLFQRARGVRHRAMPLARVVFVGGLVRVTDLRRVFRPLTDPATPPTPEVVEPPADASIFTFSARAEPGWRYAGSRISAPNDDPRWTAVRPAPSGPVRAAVGAREYLFCLAADDRLWRYDPHADHWDALAELDDDDLTDVEMAKVDGRLHLLGWKGDAIAHWAFLFDENRWEPRAPPPVARHDFALASAKNKLYAAGGVELRSRRLSDRVETYDPKNGSSDRFLGSATARVAIFGCVIPAAGGREFAAGGRRGRF